MAEKFSHEMLLKVVAQLCQMVGFEKIMTSVLYTLADILGAFIKNLGKTTRRYSEHCGRTHVNEIDLSLAFYEFNIIPSELVEFLKLVSPLPKPLSVPKYPVVTRNQLSEGLPETETIDSLQDPSEKPSEVQSQLKENLKIKISLKKIKESCKVNKLKIKKFKENKKRRKKYS